MTDSTGCCREYRCRRKQPYKLGRSALTDRIYLLTRWKWSRPKALLPGAPDLLEAIEKHDVTEEVMGFIRHEFTGTMWEIRCEACGATLDEHEPAEVDACLAVWSERRDRGSPTADTSLTGSPPAPAQESIGGVGPR